MIKHEVQFFLQDSNTKRVFKAITGIDNVDVISNKIAEIIYIYLQEKITKLFLFNISSGVVFGLLLKNQKKIIFKIYSPKFPISYLREMHNIEKIFQRNKFPLPQIFSPIIKFGSSHAVIYEYIEGQKENAHQPQIRNELAKYLVRFSEIVDYYNIPPMSNFLQQPPPKHLWPLPSEFLSNFSKSGRGAKWIAKKALESKIILRTCRLKMKCGYTDWGIKNTIFKNQKLISVIDWDSLGGMSEPEMLGRAAMQFTTDWGTSFGRIPSPEESHCFIQAYEKYRSKKFSANDYRIMSAACDYLIAVLARQEQCDIGKREYLPYQELLKKCLTKSFLFI